MQKKTFVPIILLFVVVIVLFFSPFILSWLSKIAVFLVDGGKSRIQWLNQNEEISSLPGLQFIVPDGIDTNIIEDSFHTKPEIRGTWTWLEDDLVVWQPDQPLPTGQMVQFGFEEMGSQKPVLRSVSWEAIVRSPEIVFLQSVESGKEIFSLSHAEPESVTQLSNTQGLVIDFAVSPSGEQIIFSQTNSQLGADLWLMDRSGKTAQVLDCGIDRCSSMDWNPIRDEILFTIEKNISSNSQPSWDFPSPQILNLVDGNTQPVLNDPLSYAYDPIWSSKGQWITFWRGENLGIEIVHEGSKETVFRDTRSDDTGCWSPNERYFYFSKVREEGIPIVSVINQLEIFSVQQTFYTGSDLYELGYNYYYPECHPQGEGLMSVVQVDPLIPQRELWWITADNAYTKIYSDLTKMVTQFKWSPDGRQGIFLRDTLSGLADGAEIVLWQAEEPEKLIAFQDHVFKIEWLP
jgi:dipeptidyl aminopeptidase/acylaminoacyl peptidase